MWWHTYIIRQCDEKKEISFELFMSAIFNNILDKFVEFDELQRIKPKLKDIFDRNHNDKIDAYEYDKATENEDVSEICKRLLSQPHIKSSRQTISFLSIPNETMTSVMFSAPRYPPVLPEHASLIRHLTQKKELNGFSDYRLQNAFQSVPRHMFLPDAISVQQAYKDDPILYDDLFHQSAPHMYAFCMINLEMNVHNKISSFLSIGSGTGYLSVLVAVMQQWVGVNHGIELKEKLVSFSRERIKAFAQKCNVKSNIEIFSGNCFTTKLPQKYDRIYVGAGCTEETLPKLLSFLEDEGRMLVPLRKQEFTSIIRQGKRFTRKRITDVNYKMLELPSLPEKMAAMELGHHHH